jgi:phenylacetate-coenzyme A ligase PaaK-like adenylate-forming protein
MLHRFPFNRDKIKALQLRKLKKLLVHSYENIEFYRERMASCGFNPYKIRSLSELEQLPVLSKEEYRSFVDRVLIKNPEAYKSWYFDSTSGSTGIPLRIVRTWPERGYMIAKWLRELYLNGFSCTDHSFRAVTPYRLTAGKDIFLQNFGLFRRTLLPFTAPDREIVESYQEAQPDFYYSTQNGAIRFCKYALEHNIKIKKPKMYSVGGSVIDQNCRELFTSVLGGDNFFETYAAEETGVLAFQIRGSSGLNFSHDTTILELVAPDGSIVENEGSCLITDLGIYSFPMIRYELGDQLETYTDESGLRKIKKIRGRLNDWLVWRDGSRSGMGYFYEIMARYTSSISQFRIIQEDYEHIRILIVLSPLRDQIRETPAGIEHSLVESLNKHLRADIEYQVEFVDRIPPDETGKIRIIISKVQ